MEENGEEGKDYLYELGRQSVNTNIDVGAKTGNIDSLFTGGFLGVDGDIASGRLRNYEIRSLSHIDGDYYMPPAFVERFCLHMVKNYLKMDGKIPLILGVWGPKGCGKSFQVELCCKKMGVTPIILSAGELEDEWAGNPGRLIRERYRKAAQVIKNQGKMSCLIINDIDATCGRLKDTQMTVNNQMVMGTLMNLCDDPTRVSVGEEWNEGDIIARCPIIVTANDLSTLYAPLLRDGRMDKTFEDDGYSLEDMGALLDRFPDQPLDFFGALRSRMYDSGIFQWVQQLGGEEEVGKLLMAMARQRRRADKPQRISNSRDEAAGYAQEGQQDAVAENREEEGERDEGAAIFDDEEDAPFIEDPIFDSSEMDFSFARLVQQAEELAQEQQHVMEHSLAYDYLRWQDNPEEVQKTEVSAEELEQARQAKQEAEEALRKAADRTKHMMASMMEEQRRMRASQPPPPPPPEPEPEPEPEPKDWWEVRVLEAHGLVETEGYTLLDVRAQRDFDKECAKGSVNVPAVVLKGRPLHWEEFPIDSFIHDLQMRFPAGSKLAVIGGESSAASAMQQMVDAGYSEIAEVVGGYESWNKLFKPNGARREADGQYKIDYASGGDMCVGADLPVI
ncbi:hypothetical protein CYMTET_36667 [Cymbomonas tetramitiformis]|uniref:Ribulose bisphosphate carboxylase/oxygenase activase, chloroplastic n=1 Tax=Cymbomonas tetramitiformis TaxID=36881 RepID=A0AAE0CH87_9CHLO|nr:hypothetical protein CYMTET_36667 [Cymbomonas tetramitiformis]